MGRLEEPRLALQPGATATIGRRDGRVAIALPRRFDGLMAGFLALALPVIALLTAPPDPLRDETRSRKRS